MVSQIFYQQGLLSGMFNKTIETSFNKSFTTTVDCQLKWFQLRLIHKVLPTNRFVVRRKIIKSAKFFIGLIKEGTIILLLPQ